MKYDLDSPEQATTLMQSLWPKVKTALAAGKKLTLEVKDASKSREQERLYHELIGQIAKQAQHLGAKWSADDFKRLLVDQFAREIGLTGAKIIPNLDGTGFVQLGVQTRKFTVDQGSQFIEWLYAWAANNGVTLDDTRSNH
jgi:hypothetical protein